MNSAIESLVALAPTSVRLIVAHDPSHHDPYRPHYSPLHAPLGGTPCIMLYPFVVLSIVVATRLALLHHHSSHSDLVHIITTIHRHRRCGWSFLSSLDMITMMNGDVHSPQNVHVILIITIAIIISSWQQSNL